MDDSRSRELASALGAASEQIGLALEDSHRAVDRLGVSLEKLAALLAQDFTSAAAQQQVTELRAEMARAITALQFHDRMTQHLTHVRDYLEGTAESLQGESAGLDSLNHRLADRLLSDTHRIHLGRNFAIDFQKARQRSAGLEHAAMPQGDIDLF